MKKYLVIASILVVGLQANGYAMPGFDLLQGKAIHQALNQPSLNVVPKDAPCVDFTGVWNGSCQISGGESSPSTLAISQKGCSSVTVNGSEIQVGALGSGTIAGIQDNTPYGVSAVGTADWNPQADTLLGTLSLAVKPLGKAGVAYVSGQSSMKMDGQGLVLLATIADYKIQCGYVKQ